MGCIDGTCVPYDDLECGESGEACCENSELVDYDPDAECLDGRICFEAVCTDLDDLPCGDRN